MKAFQGTLQTAKVLTLAQVRESELDGLRRLAMALQTEIRADGLPVAMPVHSILHDSLDDLHTKHAIYFDGMAPLDRLTADRFCQLRPYPIATRPLTKAEFDAKLASWQLDRQRQRKLERMQTHNER